LSPRTSGQACEVFTGSHSMTKRAQVFFCGIYSPTGTSFLLNPAQSITSRQSVSRLVVSYSFSGVSSTRSLSMVIFMESILLCCVCAACLSTGSFLSMKINEVQHFVACMQYVCFVAQFIYRDVLTLFVPSWIFRTMLTI
jgi:formate hydrogenlyase subunit 4